MKKEIKIFTIGLQRNYPTIMVDPPVEYLKMCNFPQITYTFFSQDVQLLDHQEDGGHVVMVVHKFMKWYCVYAYVVSISLCVALVIFAMQLHSGCELYLKIIR